jgi:adenine-specific DNA-methyltransferase
MHPKVLIDDLLRQTKDSRAQESGHQTDLFADFNGIPMGVDKTNFYQHDQNWSNRMILGDSLQVMASLAEREGLRGKVQCIYFDPPYGIKFNSNFQWSTTSRDVKDGKADHITREPEQVKAFRDTWRDGIHSYLTYLRDRLTVARDLLTESGSIFVQIGDENVHRVRAVMDEVFGDENLVAQIYFITTSGRQDDTIDRLGNYFIWFAKDRLRIKYRQLYVPKDDDEQEAASDLQSQGIRTTGSFEVRAFENAYTPLAGNHWKATEDGVRRLLAADRIKAMKRVIRYRRFSRDFPVSAIGDVWADTGGGAGQDKIYVVQTGTRVPTRCILMATDPGDLVLDPTCGSGTTAYGAEQWGRRWITIDPSRVALALARARIMGARYPYYLLADSKITSRWVNFTLLQRGDGYAYA